MANLVAWWEELNRELAKTPEYLAESLAFRLSLEIYRQMKEAGLSQTAFAKRLGVSKAYVSQIFDGKANLTLLSLSKVAKALGADLSVTLGARGRQRSHSVLAFPKREDIVAANESSPPVFSAGSATAASESYAGERNVI